MKKLLAATLVALAALTLTACGGAKPSQTLKDYFKAVETGNYQKAASMIDIEQEDVAELTSLMEQKAPAAMKENGGYKSMEIVSEEIAEDGLSATVKAKVIYGSSEEEEEYNLVKKDGKWLLSFGNK